VGESRDSYGCSMSIRAITATRTPHPRDERRATRQERQQVARVMRLERRREHDRGGPTAFESVLRGVSALR
jgi:hypothetical protein